LAPLGSGLAYPKKDENRDYSFSLPSHKFHHHLQANIQYSATIWQARSAGRGGGKMLSSGISSAVGFVDLTGEWSVFLFALRCACLDTGLLLLQRTMAKPPKGQYECMGASKEMGYV
jgi:hypothetical protein